MVWAVYEDRLKTVGLEAVLSLETGLAAGDPSAAWMAWSNAAVRALADALTAWLEAPCRWVESSG